MSSERAQLSVAFCLERLRIQAEELANRQYAGDHTGPRSWLNLARGIIDTAEGYLLQCESARSSSKGNRLARDAARLCNITYASLDYLRGAGTDELPYPLVPPFQRWLHALGLDNTAIFRAEAVANYELVKISASNFKRIRDPSRSLQDAIGQITWPLLRITVPSKAFAIIPHFAIVAHEIGHALVERVPWDIAAFARAEEKNLFNRVALRLGQSTLDRSTSEILFASFGSWFQELASDAIAHYLTGPAIFFSFADFAQLLGGGYGSSVTHPPHDLRRRILYRQLKKGGGRGFAAVFRKYGGVALSEDFNSPLLAKTPSADEVFKDALSGALRRVYDRQTAAVVAELHSSIGALTQYIYPQAEQYLRSSAPKLIYTPANFAADLKHHLAPMLAAIPPVERRVGRSKQGPTDFASILNVGWVTLLTKLGKLRVATENDTERDRLESLHGLLLKAVELSEIRREWEAA